MPSGQRRVSYLYKKIDAGRELLNEAAAAIAYLASPLARATTGTVLAVHGGMSDLRLRPPSTPGTPGTPGQPGAPGQPG